MSSSTCTAVSGMRLCLRLRVGMGKLLSAVAVEEGGSRGGRAAMRGRGGGGMERVEAEGKDAEKGRKGGVSPQSPCSASSTSSGLMSDRVRMRM